VQAVWPADEFDSRVMAFCEKLAAKPADAVGVAKIAIDLCKDLDRAGGRHVERIANTPLVLRDNKQRIDDQLSKTQTSKEKDKK
jgi:hypothetical protein